MGQGTAIADTLKSHGSLLVLVLHYGGELLELPAMPSEALYQALTPASCAGQTGVVRGRRGSAGHFLTHGLKDLVGGIAIEEHDGTTSQEEEDAPYNILMEEDGIEDEDGHEEGQP